MITVEGNTPGPEAGDPKHPAHAQWVKDQMLRRETDWIRSLGGAPVSSRDVERTVDRGMERLYARQREKRTRQLDRSRQRAERKRGNIAEQMARDTGYRFRKRPAPKLVSTPLGTAAAMDCRGCGRCRRCRREARVKAIIQQGGYDRMVTRVRTRHVEWTERLANAVVRCQLGKGEFAELAGPDRDRVITALIEQICDESTGAMGQWR